MERVVCVSAGEEWCEQAFASGRGLLPEVEEETTQHAFEGTHSCVGVGVCVCIRCKNDEGMKKWKELKCLLWWSEPDTQFCV